MRWSQSLIPTSKDVPADAQIVSHQLMLRAGLIRQVSAGVYAFLPMGLRSLQKAGRIIRREMEAVGCAEVSLPALQPLELWRKTGRDVSYGQDLMHFEDRHGRTSALAPGDEEAATQLISTCVNSYKQLPLALYQIRAMFRDEYRPRLGLLRLRESLAQEAWSFHASTQSLDEWTARFYGAYERILRRCGIRYAAVEAGSGLAGGQPSYEFMAHCPAGEDILFSSDKENYSASLEKCETGDRPYDLSGQPRGELEKVHTPGMHSIDEVAGFLKVAPTQILKTLVYQASPGPGEAFSPKWVVAVVRGDHDVNEGKLLKLCQERFNIGSIQLADTPEIREQFAIGFVGPDAAMGSFFAILVIDPDAAQDRAWVAGANEADYHVRNFNWFRDAGDRIADPAKTLVADIRNAVEGDPSPKNDGGVLKVTHGIRLAQVLRIGTRYSLSLDALYLDDKGQKHPIVMGSYGMSLPRILAAAVEQSHDDKGIIWPTALAPYSVCITPVRYEGETRAAADRLYTQLNAAGIDTILDDRDARPGFKFADADLIGFPVRINVGDRSLKEGAVEIKPRRAAQPTPVPLDQVLQHIHTLLEQA